MNHYQMHNIRNNIMHLVLQISITPRLRLQYTEFKRLTGEKTTKAYGQNRHTFTPFFGRIISYRNTVHGIATITPHFYPQVVLPHRVYELVVVSHPIAGFCQLMPSFFYSNEYMGLIVKTWMPCADDNLQECVQMTDCQGKDSKI